MPLNRRCSFTRKETVVSNVIVYENRLSHSQLGLESLLRRRVQTDLLVRYQMLHNLVNVDCVNFFQRSTLSYTRGNVMNFDKPRIISTRDSHFFTNRTVNLWNSLPDSIVTVPTVTCFKSRLDKFLC